MQYLIAWAAGLTAAFVIFVRFVVTELKKQRQNEPDSAHESKIFTLYQEIESMLDAFEDYVKEVHEEIEKERSALTDMSRQATAMYMKVLEDYGRTALPSRPETAEPVKNAEEKTTGQKLERKPEQKPERKPEQKPEQKPERKQSSRLTPNDKDTLGRFATKAQKVRFLMSRGLSLDEVAKELDIGKGEVLLIAGLEK